MAMSMEVTIVSAHACTTVDSPLVGLEIPNASLLCWKRDGKNLSQQKYLLAICCSGYQLHKIDFLAGECLRKA